jgi:hypothetical protein
VLAVTVENAVIWNPNGEVDKNTMRTILSLRTPLRHLIFRGNHANFAQITLAQMQGYNVLVSRTAVNISSEAIKRYVKPCLQQSPWMLGLMPDPITNDSILHKESEQIDGLKRFVELCDGVGTRPCIFMPLLHNVEEILMYVKPLIEIGITDVVCSPIATRTIRKEYRPESISISTAVCRPLSKDKGAECFATPKEAMISGANQVIVSGDLTDDLPENIRQLQHYLDAVS